MPSRRARVVSLGIAVFLGAARPLWLSADEFVVSPACQALNRRYEFECLIARAESRSKLNRDGDAEAHERRGGLLDVICAEITESVTLVCPPLDLVPTSAEFREWYRHRETEQKQRPRGNTVEPFPDGVTVPEPGVTGSLDSPAFLSATRAL
jgi:hypothetical protein